MRHPPIYHHLPTIMLRHRLIKIIAGFLIIGQFLFLPVLALAQVGALNPVPTNDSGSVASNAIYEGPVATPKAAYESCLKAVNASDATDTGAQLGFSGLALIGGDKVLLVTLGKKISAYQIFITCATIQRIIISGIPAPNVFSANKKQDLMNQISQAIVGYKTKLEQAQARYNNAKQGFWKTLVVTILIKTSKAVATALVTKITQNHTIRDFKQYADSLATLTYDNQFIRDNFPKAQGQLMARAVLENPLFRTQIPPGIFVAADEALGFDPKALSPNDPFFYAKMASVGSASANPYYQHSVIVGGVDQAHANALAYANGNIMQSQGFKAPVTCAGTLAQQQSIDARTKAASDKLDDRTALLNNLKQAKALGQPVKDADLKQAQADYDAAFAGWKGLPASVTADSKTSEGGAAIKICEAIVSPSALVSKGLDQAFNAIGFKMAQYNDNNLPGFMSLIGDVASQIGSSLIFGGGAGAKGAALINEGRLVNGAVEVANEAVYAKTSANLANGIVFGPPEPNPSVTNGYTLNWDIITDEISTASFVTIYGDGISATVTDPKTHATIPNKLPLSGNFAITTATGGDYILTVFDQNGRALTSGTTTITPSNNSQTGGSGAGGSGGSGGSGTPPASQSKITFAVPSATLEVNKSQIYNFQVFNSDGSVGQAGTFNVNSLSPDVATVLSENNGENQFSVSAVSPGAALIVVTWQDNTGAVITSPPFTVTVVPAGQSAYIDNSPTVALSTALRATSSGVEKVAGAFTNQQPLDIRGPTVHLSIRGQ